MFTIDVKSDNQFYIIYLNGKKFCKISKSNHLGKVLKFFNDFNYVTWSYVKDLFGDLSEESFDTEDEEELINDIKKLI